MIGSPSGRLVDACPYDPALPAEGEAGRLSGAVEAMDRAGVRIAVFVVRGEVEELMRQRARHPGRLYGWACYDSLRPERGLEEVRALCESRAGAFVGVATLLSCYDQDPRLKAFAPLYDYCTRQGLPILFRADGARPLALGVLAAAYPALRIVCLHDEAEAPTDLPARFPNLFLASGGAVESGAPQVEPPDIQRLARAVGCRKLMFARGGQAPVAGYDRSLEALSRLTWWQRSNVGWRTALRVFGPRLREARP